MHNPLSLENPDLVKKLCQLSDCLEIFLIIPCISSQWQVDSVNYYAIYSIITHVLSDCSILTLGNKLPMIEINFFVSSKHLLPGI